MKYHGCGSCLPVTGMSLDFMIYTLCSMVWHERNLIIEMNTPNQLKDLLLEQSKYRHRCHPSGGMFSIRLSGLIHLLFVFFSTLFHSSSLWIKWVCCIHRRIHRSRYSSMAGHRIRLLWVLWWCSTKWQRWQHKKRKTFCERFTRQLFGSYDRFSCRCFWSFC